MQALLPKILAPLKGGTIRIGIPTIFYRLVGLLVFDVFSDLLLIQSNRIHILPASPKAVPFEIPFQPAVFLEHDHGTLTFQVADYG